MGAGAGAGGLLGKLGDGGKGGQEACAQKPQENSHGWHHVTVALGRDGRRVTEILRTH